MWRQNKGKKQRKPVTLQDNKNLQKKKHTTVEK